MSKFQEYTQVRIRQLIQNVDEYDVWKVNQRIPAVGDIGTLIDILHADGLPDKYIVEKTDTDGVPIWLSNFFKEELETA